MKSAINCSNNSQTQGVMKGKGSIEVQPSRYLMSTHEPTQNANARNRKTA